MLRRTRSGRQAIEASSSSSPSSSSFDSLSDHDNHVKLDPAMTLGLQPLLAPDAPPVPLLPGHILGRTPKKDHDPQLQPDLGMNKHNADGVGRHVCSVQQVNSNVLQLEMNPRILQGNFYKPEFYRKGDQSRRYQARTKTLNLYPGDTLVFPARGDCPKHYFQVIAMPVRAARTQTNMKKKPTVAPGSPALAPIRITPTASSASKDKRTEHDNQDDSRPKKRARYQFPWDILTPSSTTSTSSEVAPPKPSDLLKILEAEQESRLPQGPTPRFHGLNSNESDDDSEDDNDEDDLNGENSFHNFFRVFPLHSTDGNTYSRALQSMTPEIGSNMLHLTLNHGRLPNPKLAQELVQLLTFGACDKKQDYSSISMQLAWQYVQTCFDKYPSKAYDLLAAQTGPDYWKNIMDQLYTLPYLDTEKEHDKNDVEALIATQQSLQVHVFSLRLFERLFQAMLHRSEKDPEASLPILRDFQKYGSLAATKIMAQVLAYVWVQYGREHLFGAPQPKGKAGSPLMTDLLSELTTLLSSIVRMALYKFVIPNNVNNNNRNKVKRFGEAVEILWNAMFVKLQETPHQKNYRKKEDSLTLKCLWIESFQDSVLEEALAKRLGIFNEYKTILW